MPHTHNDHAHGAPCDCGGHHDHGCDCGHHVHTADCGCGHDHHEVIPIDGLSNVQMHILLTLHQQRYLPVARFSMTAQADLDAYGVALAPVYLSSPDDEMEAVKELGTIFQALEDANLITIDYDIELSGYDYAEYETSGLYAYFVKTVEEGKTKPGVRFDTPNLERGSMALTKDGEAAISEMTRSAV